jgi:hypothetical protein
MARPRISKVKAIITGRASHDPKRFKSRTEPKGGGPIGLPPADASKITLPNDSEADPAEVYFDD